MHGTYRWTTVYVIVVLTMVLILEIISLLEG